jgi:hypothetical protein
MQIIPVEFELPDRLNLPNAFSGYVCFGWCVDVQTWKSACDTDSAMDAYNDLCNGRNIAPHTIRMFQVGK